MPQYDRSSARSSSSRSGSGRPQRSGGGRSRGSSSARPAATSALEQALTAAQDANVPTDLTFAELGLPEALVTELTRQGMDAPFAIQSRVLPDAIAGRDVVARAQTGGGKTLGFGLPMLTRLAAGGGRVDPGKPRALVLVPTRELARQVTEALSPLAGRQGQRVAAVYGGAPMGRQIDAMRRGPHVVVATPGRLEDLIKQRACSLDQVEVTVLDEADHMADLGFMPAVTRILADTPAGGQRLLFSATLDRNVEKLVHTYLSDPALHAVAASSSPVEAMDHVTLAVAFRDKVDITTAIAGRPARTLIFVRTKHGADRLAEQLSKAGVPAAAIHGNLNQGQRLRALDAFSGGSPRVLVATDVAARGIHVDDVDMVVHYDPPADHKDYLHRSGRTARAGASGTVVSLLLPDQARDAERLLATAGVAADHHHRVDAFHPEVARLGASGEPVVVTTKRPFRTPSPSSGYRGAGAGGGYRGQGRPSGRPSSGGYRGQGGPGRTSGAPRTSFPAPRSS